MKEIIAVDLACRDQQKLGERQLLIVFARRVKGEQESVCVF